MNFVHRVYNENREINILMVMMERFDEMLHVFYALWCFMLYFLFDETLSNGYLRYATD